MNIIRILIALVCIAAVGCSTDLTYYAAYSEPRAGYDLECSLPYEIFLPMNRYPLSISISPRVTGKLHMKIKHYYVEPSSKNVNKLRILKEEVVRLDVESGKPQEYIFDFTAIEGIQSIYIESELSAKDSETYTQTALVSIEPE